MLQYAMYNSQCYWSISSVLSMQFCCRYSVDSQLCITLPPVTPSCDRSHGHDYRLTVNQWHPCNSRINAYMSMQEYNINPKIDFERAGETTTATRGHLFTNSAIRGGVHSKLQSQSHLPEVWVSSILDVSQRYLILLTLKYSQIYSFMRYWLLSILIYCLAVLPILQINNNQLITQLSYTCVNVTQMPILVHSLHTCLVIKNKLMSVVRYKDTHSKLIYHR